jgi:hypothetical protein
MGVFFVDGTDHRSKGKGTDEAEDRKERRNYNEQACPEANGTPLSLHEIIANLTRYRG